MSSLVLMRILEGAPQRYDAGMRILSAGRVPRLQARIAELATPEPRVRVLEIGCGTGAVTERLLVRGAVVDALDQSPEMLDQARGRLTAFRSDRLRFFERSAAEIDGLDDASYDAVVASLSFSEMSRLERRFVLGRVARLLRPGGVIVVGDEARPRRIWQRLLQVTLRLPSALATWLLTGSTTRPLVDPAAELAEAGLEVFHEERSWFGSLAIVCARRRPE